MLACWRALGLPQAEAAGENHVGLFHQRALEHLQFRRGEAELRELVHAVVDNPFGGEPAGEGQHHRGVVPADQPRLGELRAGAQQAFETGLDPPRRQALRKARRENGDAESAVYAFEGRLLAIGFEDRLFPEENPMIAGESRHQVLGPLENEIPTKMRKTDQDRPSHKLRAGFGHSRGLRSVVGS